MPLMLKIKSNEIVKINGCEIQFARSTKIVVLTPNSDVVRLGRAETVGAKT